MGPFLSSDGLFLFVFVILIAGTGLHDGRRSHRRSGLSIRVEPACGHEPRAACLYSVGRRDPNHDAVIRIGSLAPRWGTLLSSAVMPCDTAGSTPLRALRGQGPPPPPPS